MLYVECAVPSLRKRELPQQIDLCSMMCGPKCPMMKKEFAGRKQATVGIEVVEGKEVVE